MVEFAKQFLEIAYVWGGTSLTNGADCSGFVQQIYSYFGYSLPRTSREQAQYGDTDTDFEAQPGDLIFYANNGTVYHVVMYMAMDRPYMPAPVRPVLSHPGSTTTTPSGRQG